MPISQEAEPCWYVRVTGEDYGSHFATENRAQSAAASLSGDIPAAVAAGRFPQPCWFVRCDGECAQMLEDGEYEWTLHLKSRTEAEEYAASYDWTVTADGVFCEDDTPPGAQSIVVTHLPGQEPLFGQDGGQAS